MNIYSVVPDAAYGVLVQVGNLEDRERWNKARGRINAEAWQVPTVEVPSEKEEIVPVDCLCSATPPGRGFLLNKRAREALAPLLLPCGEYLPVRFGHFDYQWFNCTTMIDAADQERIEGKHDASPYLPPGTWAKISRWAFHSDRLADAPVIFGVPQERATLLLCTDVLKQAVEEHDLLGFEFEHLWSSEAGGTKLANPVAKFFGAAGREHEKRARAKREKAMARLAAEQ